jgi:DNA-binding cell septation regulator SpoVG
MSPHPHSLLDLIWELEAGLGNVRLMVAGNGHQDSYASQLDNLRMVIAELRRLVQGSTGEFQALPRSKPDTVEIEDVTPAEEPETNPGR